MDSDTSEEKVWGLGAGTIYTLESALESLDKYRELASRYGRELNEAKRELTAYQIAKDNLELRLASFLQLISQAGSSIDDHVLQVKLGAFEWRQGMPTTSSRSQVY